MRGLGVSSLHRVTARLAAALLVTAAASCRAEEEPVDCSGEPTFIVNVSAGAAALPDDLEIEVRYGGSTEPETYRLGRAHTPEVVFCVTSPRDGAASADAGAGGNHGAAGGVRCRLWTEGPASVVIRGRGYGSVSVELRIDPDRCSVIEDIELERGEGGAGS